MIFCVNTQLTVVNMVRIVWVVIVIIVVMASGTSGIRLTTEGTMLELSRQSQSLARARARAWSLKYKTMAGGEADTGATGLGDVWITMYGCEDVRMYDV